MFILKSLREKAESAWCQGMLRAFTLPPTVHHHAHHRVWQRRFYDMNIWSDKKVSEKLDTMHNNPVKRGLVEKPGDWSRLAAALRDRVGGSTTWKTVRCWRWIGCRDRIHGKNRHVCATPRM